MTGLYSLIKRNIKLYFKDKGLFFSSLITPIILLVLYVTFLRNVFYDSFCASLKSAGATVAEDVINGCVGGQLVSSLLAVSCVTVAFCSNLLMIRDKTSGAKYDLDIAPVKFSTIALGYYLATLFSTLIINVAAAGVCMVYLAATGWFMSAADVLLLFLDVFLLTMFGTALSSCINFFLSTDGQASAVGTIVSAGYGFICGAYMPISSFSDTLQKVLSFLPGTYGTSLMRNHALRGVFDEMSNAGFPDEVVKGIKGSVDCKISFFGSEVSVPAMYAVLTGSIVLFILIYVFMNISANRKRVKSRLAGKSH